jgi:O-antigen/teichoic acid export membrane protein
VTLFHKCNVAMNAGEHIQPRAICHAMPTPRSRASWLSGGLAPTAVDEVLLSGLSLAVALALIRGGGKVEYGIFALVSGIILLIRGAQNSLVLTPLATLGGRLQGVERLAFVHAMSRLQTVLGVVLALVVAGGIWLYVGSGSWFLAIGSGLALAGAWLREYGRGLAMLDGRCSAALAGDTMYAVLAGGAVVALWRLLGGLCAGTVLAATGLAAGGAALVCFRGPSAGTVPAPEHRQVTRAALNQAGWSLPGTAVAWGQSSSYAYAVGLVLGSAAVGEIAASRLFVMPLILTAVAWSRVFLPRAASLLADGRDALLREHCGRALRVAILGSALYLALLAVAFTFGLGQLMPNDYAGCEMQVLAWAGFAVTNLCRTIASNALVARLEFRLLFAITLVSAAVGLVLVLVLIKPLRQTGAIVGLTSGELVMGILCWRALLERPIDDVESRGRQGA